ncbi:MAG: branched-chain amino acid ABC transporter permease [Candidatus Taylorbacteria bacterium]|nr:branched-chain amino acid ABC transporter permease [Candidatus Taylorbacteria bacterium]
MESIVPQLMANSIIAGGIYALVALGFNLIYGATKFFNLTHGVIAAIGGYTVFYITKKNDSLASFFNQSIGGTVFAVLIGVLCAALVGYLLDKFLYKKLRDRKASPMVFLVASLGAFTCLQAFLAILFTSQFQTLGGGAGDIVTYTIFGGIITEVQAIVIVSVVVIMLVLGIFLKKSLFGKSVEAISDDEHVAKIVGIHTEKIISIVFVIGSAIAGLAGILVGYDTGLEPTMGMGLLLKGVIASIIGGIGNVYGGVLGAFLLGFVENFGIWKISGEWKDAIAFGLLIVFLIVRPQGILKR